MTEPTIPFADLRRLLLRLGFREVVVAGSHIAFLHNDSGTDLFLPVYRSDQKVAPRHLAVVRNMLDLKGLLDGAEFDQAVADPNVRHPVSN